MAVNEPADTAVPRFENKGILRFVEDSETVLARMDRSTIEIFSSLSKYREAYGPYLDRIGMPNGKYFWQLPVSGDRFSFEQRALDIFALHDPYYQYEIVDLHDSFFIRTGINVPQFNFPGGARQVQILAGDFVLTASECVQLGILVGKGQG